MTSSEHVEHPQEPDSTAIRVIRSQGERSYRVQGRSAELKLTRAKEHFDAFRSELDSYYRSTPWSMTAVRDNVDIAVVVEALAPIPDSLALIAGDLLNNARSALDCLIVELAEGGLGTLGRAVESEAEERTLSFPISARPLAPRRRTELARFLPAKAVEAVGLLQPVENTKFRLNSADPDSVSDELVRAHVHEDMLLRLQTLNNWDKHRRLTFSFLEGQLVGSDEQPGELTVDCMPGELDTLRGIEWLGTDQPRREVTDEDPNLEEYMHDPNVVIRITNPETLRMMAEQREEPDFEFHFSWWPLTVGDEVGRYIPLPGRGAVPDIAIEASLRLIFLEPENPQRDARPKMSADRLLARVIDEVQYVIEVLRSLDYDPVGP